MSQLVKFFYPELRRLAAARMNRERPGHTWQPTVLVHELYLELSRSRPPSNLLPNDEKAAFFGLAGHLMNRLLIHHARPLAKRAHRVDPESADLQRGENTLHEIEDALRRLAAIDPELRAVVELKVFEGLSEEEIALKLALSRRTVARRWNFARLWLQREYAGTEQAGGKDPRPLAAV